MKAIVLFVYIPKKYGIDVYWFGDDRLRHFSNRYHNSLFVPSDEESPVSLVKLHAIADKEEGWFQVVSSMVTVIPLENPLGPSAITIVFDDCPLPSKDSVIKVSWISMWAELGVAGNNWKLGKENSV